MTLDVTPDRTQRARRVHDPRAGRQRGGAKEEGHRSLETLEAPMLRSIAPAPEPPAAAVQLEPIQIQPVPLQPVRLQPVELLQPAEPLARTGPGRAYAGLKRAMDVGGSIALLALLSPVLLAVAVLVRLDSPGPILYAARRVGRGGREIHVLKFRSMHVDAEQRLASLLAADPSRAAEYRATFKLKQDPRLTRVGAILRRTSLDELPQFVNVLRGEMSLVGPRPVVEAELDLYRAAPGAAEAYLATRPGITGLWQVSGRNDVTYAERIALDQEYAATCSLAVDVQILARTPAAVLRGDGAY